MTLIATPTNPIPENAVAGTLKTSDGVLLRFARFAPPPGRKGTVCVFQGRGEFIEKYFEVIRDAQTRGFAVATLDWRGQGLSQRMLRDRRKGHVRNFAEYDTDLEAFMQQVVLPDCPPPIFGIGHSMGGAILIRALHRKRRWFDRLVLSAPMIEIRHSNIGLARTGIAILRAMGLGRAYIPGGGATPVSSAPFRGNVLTSDPVRYARTGAIVEAEPALGLGSPTVAWTHAAFKATDEFLSPIYSRDVRQPVLMIAAGHDEVVSTPASEQFAMRMRSGGHLIIPGARHELLMEQDRYREQFWAAFDAFVPGTPVFA